jgi:hypothetical protein
LVWQGCLAGTDDLCHGDVLEEEFNRNWVTLARVLDEATGKPAVTRRQRRAYTAPRRPP